MQKNTFEKISYSKGNILTEQIIELGRPRPFGRICTSITGCFQDETIISAKILKEAMYFTSLYLGQITRTI